MIKISTTLLAKRKLMKKLAGAFKDSKLDNDILWKDVLKRKSRKENIAKHLSRISGLRILNADR